MRGRDVVRRALALACALAVLAVGGAAAQEAPSSDDLERDVARTADERDEIAARRIRLDRELTAASEELVALRTQLADARGRLVRVEGQLALAREAAASAERRRDAARRDVEIADRLLLRTQEELARQLDALARQVAAAYKYGTPAQRSEAFLLVIQHAKDPNELANNIYKLESLVSHQDDVVRRIEELQAEQEELRAEADATRQVAELRAMEAEQTLEVVGRLADEAAEITVEITTAEARQDEIVDGLEADAATLAALQRTVEQRLDRLEVRLERRREREREERLAGGGGLCPVDGAIAGRDFINDWGFPRSGGRTHEGTDIFADRGTAVFAMWSGRVSNIHRTEYGLGGLTVSYEIAPGQYIYNAHLDTVASSLSIGDTVAPGQVIGTVGNTGNARYTPPHLHIGHYVSGSAVPMWPVLSEACA